MASPDLLSTAEWLSVSRRRLQADSGPAAAPEDLRVLKAEAAAAPGEFGGYIGDSLPVRVTVQAGPGGQPRGLDFFMKAVPADPKRALLAVQGNSFRKETGIYEEVFPRMRGPGPVWSPRVFFMRPDLLVMEDLVKQGFSERDRRNPFDLDHCAVLLEALAAFHADGLRLEAAEAAARGGPCRLDAVFPSLLAENIFLTDPSSPLGAWVQAGLLSVPPALRYLPKYRGRLEVLTERLREVMRQVFELAKPSERFRNVLCHGDLWSNNMLFRYGSDGRPAEARLLDFQLARYAPPAQDVMMTLFVTTRRLLRETRGRELLERYHSALLARLGPALAAAAPAWPEFLASCAHYRLFGMVVTTLYHHFEFVTPDLMNSVMEKDYERFMFGERISEVAACFRDDSYYREKLTEELTELVDVAVLGLSDDWIKPDVHDKLSVWS